MHTTSKAYRVGRGIGSPSATAFIIRDGGLPGGNIWMLEAAPFTGRYGLSLIYGDNPQAEEKSAMFLSDLYEREVSSTPTLHHILERPVRKSYQHQGLNE